jgi:cytochrome c biogenesis protein CcmG/thiol:disulfide interchange protein DsbE
MSLASDPVPSAPDPSPSAGGEDQPRRSRRALWIALAVGLVVALLVAVLATRPSATTVAVQSPLVGKAAPAVDARTIDGERFRLADLRGRWVVLNWFATWCVPCRIEHPDLVAFHDVHTRAGDASVVGVVYDDSVQAVKEFRAAEGGSWPLLDDPDGRLALAYGVAGVPESFLVDPDGVIVAKVLGGVERENLEELIARAEAERGGS